MADGYFSRSAPGDGLSGIRAAKAQISLKFSKAEESSSAAAHPGQNAEAENQKDEIPYDPRPLHIILAERKVEE